MQKTFCTGQQFPALLFKCIQTCTEDTEQLNTWQGKKMNLIEK